VVPPLFFILSPADLADFHRLMRSANLSVLRTPAFYLSIEQILGEY